MAAPPEKNIGNYGGQWVMNKTLSDDIDPVLQFQGIGWFTRKAIGIATVTLHVKQYVDDNKVTHIDIDQTATGGIKGTSEARALDWEFREHSDHIFGDLKGKSRWATLDLIEDDFLKQEWLDSEADKGGPNGEFVLENYVEAQAGWTGRQVWGFALVEGEKRHVRRVVVSKGDESLKIRLVYNWNGEEP